MSITFKGEDFSSPINFVGMYSDTTPMVKTDQFEAIVERADTLVLKADSLAQFTTAMYLVDAITRAHGMITDLVIPYLPGARQDRSNPTGDVLFTAKSVADDINRRFFERVISVDPHSNIMPEFIYEFEEYPLERVYEKLWKGYGGVIAPDKGAERRAKAAGKALGLPVTFGSKVRDVSTGRLSGFDVKVEAGKHYIVIDDICDGGGTFVGLGEKIREQGAYADLFVTHGIFSKGTTALKEIYKNIYTTDSRRIHERNEVLVLPIVGDMVNF